MDKNTFISNVGKPPKSVRMLYSDLQWHQVDKLVFTRNCVVNPTVQVHINGEIHQYSWIYVADKKMSMWVQTKNVEGRNSKQAKTFIYNLVELPKQISKTYSDNDRMEILEVEFVKGDVPTIVVVFPDDDIHNWQFRENNQGNPDFPCSWQLNDTNDELEAA